MGSQTQVHYLLLHGCAPHLWYLLVLPNGPYGGPGLYDAHHGSRRCLARGFPARNVGPGNGQTRRKTARPTWRRLYEIFHRWQQIGNLY